MASLTAVSQTAAVNWKTPKSRLRSCGSH